MKNKFFFLSCFLMLATVSSAQAARLQRLQTSGQARSMQFNSTYELKTIEQFRVMIIEQAKGESMIKANEICEEQLRGHIYLNYRLFTPEKCTYESTSPKTADFFCTVDAVNYCIL